MTNLRRLVAALCLAVGSLAAAFGQEPVTLRYAWQTGQSLAWTLTMKVSASGSITMAGNTQPVQLKNEVTLPLFIDVLDVSAEGLATVRLSVGLVVTEMVTPLGDIVRTETDFKTGRVATHAGGQVTVEELPEAAKGLLVDHFDLVLDDRGQVKELRLPDEVRVAMSKAMKGLAAGVGDLAEWANWLEPPLPEEPVAPGATWQVVKPLAQLRGDFDVPDVTTTYTYEGVAMVDRVACHNIAARSEATEVNLTLPPEWGAGVETTLENFTVATDLRTYLSVRDSHLLRLEGTVNQWGIIRQKGNMQMGGQQVPVDHTVKIDYMTLGVECTRQ